MSVTLDRPYATLAEVKSFIGITAITYDDDIKTAINKASRYIDGVTQRYYYKKTYTAEYLNGTRNYDGWQILDNDEGGIILTPFGAPIIAITSLTESAVALVENTDYYLHKASGIIEKAAGNWSSEPRKILITGTCGYDSADTQTPSADIPGDVAQYALELSARFSGQYKKAIKNYVSGAAESMDLFGIPKEIEAALRRLRPINIL